MRRTRCGRRKPKISVYVFTPSEPPPTACFVWESPKLLRYVGVRSTPVYSGEPVRTHFSPEKGGRGTGVSILKMILQAVPVEVHAEVRPGRPEYVQRSGISSDSVRKHVIGSRNTLLGGRAVLPPSQMPTRENSNVAKAHNSVRLYLHSSALCRRAEAPVWVLEPLVRRGSRRPPGQCCNCPVRTPLRNR